jgi:DNA-binding transcriptional LysR family regulator
MHAGDVDWTPVDRLTAQKRLVEAGFGLALMTESGVAEELAAGTLVAIDVADLTPTIPIYAVTRRGGFLGAAASRLLNLLGTDFLARD